MSKKWHSVGTFSVDLCVSAFALIQCFEKRTKTVLLLEINFLFRNGIDCMESSECVVEWALLFVHLILRCNNKGCQCHRCCFSVTCHLRMCFDRVASIFDIFFFTSNFRSFPSLWTNNCNLSISNTISSSMLVQSNANALMNISFGQLLSRMWRRRDSFLKTEQHKRSGKPLKVWK